MIDELDLCSERVEINSRVFFQLYAQGGGGAK